MLETIVRAKTKGINPVKAWIMDDYFPLDFIGGGDSGIWETVGFSYSVTLDNTLAAPFRAMKVYGDSVKISEDGSVSESSLNRFDEVWLDGYEWKFVDGVATLVENPNCMASKNPVTFPGGFKRGDSNIGWWSNINVNGYMMCCKSDGSPITYPQLERRGRFWDNTAEWLGYPQTSSGNPDTEFAYGLIYIFKKDGVTPDSLKTLIADSWHYNCAEYIKADLEPGDSRIESVDRLEVEVGGKNLFDTTTLDSLTVNSSGAVRKGHSYSESGIYTVSQNGNMGGTFYAKVKNADGTYGNTLYPRNSITQAITSGQTLLVYCEDVSISLLATSDIQVEHGNTATSYTPYVDPQLAEVELKSRNLFDETKAINNKRVNASDGSISNFGAVAVSDYIHIDGDVVYIGGNATSVETGHRIAFYDKSKAFISGVQGASGVLPNTSYNAPSNAEYCIINMAIADKDKITVSSIQLTDYQPYFDNTLYGINGVKDVADVDGGEITRKIVTYTFVGNEKWNVASDGAKYIEGFNNLIGTNVGTDVTKVETMSDILDDEPASVARRGSNMIACQLNGSSSRVWVSSDVDTSVLTGTTTYFVRSEPTTEPLIADTSQLKALHTYDGQTNVSVESGEAVATVNVEYKKKQ